MRMFTHVFAFYLTFLGLVEAQGGVSTNFLNPGKPVKGEEEEFANISPLKRFFHKFGMDLDPSDVIVGVLILAFVGGAGWYAWKMKQDEKEENAGKDDEDK